MRPTYPFIVCLTLAVAACGQEEQAPAGATAQIDQPSRSEAAQDREAAIALWVQYPGQNDFEAWLLRGGERIDDAVAMAPDATMSADRIVLGEEGVAGWRLADMAIEAGDTVTARVWLWNDEPTRVNLQLVRWCSDTPAEVGNNVVDVGADGQMYEVSHTFEHAHDCVRFQISGLQANSAVYAWNASVERQ